MSPVRILGSVLSLLSGLLAALIALYAPHPPVSCPSGKSCSVLVPVPRIGSFPSSMSEAHWALFLVGAILAAVSLVSFSGMRLSFVFGAVLSAAVVLTLAVWWGTYSTSDELLAAAFAAVALIVDAVASRPSKQLSEKDSPLNLPVFG